jgi:hypothetical protein
MQKAAGRKRFALAALSAFCIVPSAFAAQAAWTAHPSDGVTLALTRVGDVNRAAFDFRGHSGYAIARRDDVNLDLPPNYQFVFRIRGDAPVENLEFKLIDGDNVWWLNRRDFAFPRAWTELKTKKRQIAFAWGPAGGGEIRHVQAIEVVVTAGSGGRGTVWFSDPVLEPLPPTPTEPLHFTTSTIDLGAKREIGGLTIEPGAFRVVVDGVAHKPETSKFVWLPDVEARRIVIVPVGGQAPSPVRVTVQPPTWAPTANDFWSIVAKAAPRGAYPRYFLGEQSYWTIVGADGAPDEALVGEDGAVEPFKGGWSIEPFLRTAEGRRLTWADVEIRHALEEDDLPIPSVTWISGTRSMTVKAAVSDTSMLQLRYVVSGDATLELDWRNFQVNPSTQFLNVQGGVSLHPTRERTQLYAGQRVVELHIPLRSGARAQSFERIAGDWREKLHRVAFDVDAAPRIGNTVRSSIAYMLINRDGDALKPGARAYDRAWIRDGALMAALLLRLGHPDAARRFAQWYVSYDYPSGKVPCCVNASGADPVPENDSEGELIWLVAEIDRLTHDRALVERLWPHVERAARYINELRAQNHGAFEGLVTESISHEGYSARPMHSYWDDFFALRGLIDAHDPQAARFQQQLTGSIAERMYRQHLDYIPGSAELADYDPTSTAIAVSPLGFGSILPGVYSTFDRYLRSLQHARDEYTPYETRIIGALIRLGMARRAVPLIDYFLADQRPPEWNQWAEVVRRDPRKAGFIGDMPHAWVASDFVRSMLDAVVYDRDDGTLVIGAGIPQSWLAKPIHVGPVATYSGSVDVRVHDGIVEVTGDATPKRLIVFGRDVPPQLPVRIAP